MKLKAGILSIICFIITLPAIAQPVKSYRVFWGEGTYEGKKLLYRASLSKMVKAAI